MYQDTKKLTLIDIRNIMDIHEKLKEKKRINNCIYL